MTLPLTEAKSFGQKAMVVIHYQVHNRSRLHWASRDRSATVRKKSTVFDHWPGSLLLNKTLANPVEQGYLFVLIYFSPGRPCTSNRLSALSTPWFSSLFGVLGAQKHPHPARHQIVVCLLNLGTRTRNKLRRLKLIFYSTWRKIAVEFTAC